MLSDPFLRGRDGMHIDVAVRTVVRAEPAADAPIFDDDVERFGPVNRIHRATDHADRVLATAT